ncbi:glycosyltransferase family 61 protein [Burkholderia sp. R-69980]|nr:glycosyltransferase family 61 protein [Burkholderia sp. R-69980]
MNALFDAKWYWQENPDVEAARHTPLDHYLKFGAMELRSPSVLFDARAYVAQKPEAATLQVSVLEDFLSNGGFEGFNPNAYFDSAWYLSEYEDARESGINPLLHYISTGEDLGHWPSPHFEPNKYRIENSEICWSIESPLVHFLKTRPVVPATAIVSETHFRNKESLRRYVSRMGPTLEPKPASIELKVSSAKVALRCDTNCWPAAEITSFEASAEAVVPSVAFPGQPYVARIPNAIAVGGSRYVIAGSNAIIHDEEAFFFNDAGAAVKSRLARRLPNGRLSLQFGLRQGAWIDCGINVMHEYSNNYFHFIAETLPRIMLAEEADIPASVPFLFEDGLFQNIRKLIDLVNTAKRPIIYLEPQTLYDVAEMYLPSDVSTVPDAYYGGLLARQSALDVTRIKRAVDRCSSHFDSKVDDPGRRIFVGRSGNMRVLRNQKEIESRLVEMGFEIVRADDLNIETQIRLFRQASIVIAPTGAQITNIVWCRPCTELVVLASDHPSHQLYLWELLGRVSCANVHTIQGPRAFVRDGRFGVHDDYTVDVEAITALAIRLISEKKTSRRLSSV